MSKGDESGSRVTVRLDGELNSLVEHEREQGRYTIPKSEVVRAALKEYFAENEVETEQCPA